MSEVIADLFNAFMGVLNRVGNLGLGGRRRQPPAVCGMPPPIGGGGGGGWDSLRFSAVFVRLMSGIWVQVCGYFSPSLLPSMCYQTNCPLFLTFTGMEGIRQQHCSPTIQRL